MRYWQRVGKGRRASLTAEMWSWHARDGDSYSERARETSAPPIIAGAHRRYRPGRRRHRHALRVCDFRPFEIASFPAGTRAQNVVKRTKVGEWVGVGNCRGVASRVVKKIKIKCAIDLPVRVTLHARRTLLARYDIYPENRSVSRE